LKNAKSHRIILGVNAYHGDSSACLLRDGVLVAAVEEERLRRIKHWAGFPSEAIQYCLQEADVKPEEIDHVAFSRNPMAHLHSKVKFAITHGPGLGFMRDRISNMARVSRPKDQLAFALGVRPSELATKIHRIEHHLSHSASAFNVSPFDNAAVVSIDAFGDFRSTMVSVGEGSRLKQVSSVGFPHSLGILYTAVTQYLGFLRYGDEYKVMGLASYGEPTYIEEFRRMVSPGSKGTFKLGLDYFLHASLGVNMAWDNTEPRIDRAYSDFMCRRLGPSREPDEEVTDRHKNIAASLQAVLQEIYYHVLNYAYDAIGKKSLALAGGVAFNSVANGGIYANTPFEDVYIQAAAGDAGTALGAACYLNHQVLGQPRVFEMNTAFWGPGFDEKHYVESLERAGLDYVRLSDDDLYHSCAERIASGKILGWFQGRTEWGPRALGNRSILADPRRPEMKDILNSRIKRREQFRPFAPSILAESVADYFEESYPDPFMMKVYPVKEDKRSEIPAVTHVDGTGRLQTVSKKENPRYWALIQEFEKQTGVPLILNTSFNENEPIVCTPEQAVESFLRTDMDVLVLGNCMVERTAIETV